jgi:hypothetical protein
MIPRKISARTPRSLHSPNDAATIISATQAATAACWGRQAKFSLRVPTSCGICPQACWLVAGSLGRYYWESVHGTVVTTNLNTGGTYTNVFTVNSRDHTIVDNGDGTITITSFASGSSRFYDTDGNFVLKDPGQVRIAFDIDYNGTPGDPSDDIEVPDSFRVVRGSTGNSDLSDRDFCADLVEFTS